MSVGLLAVFVFFTLQDDAERRRAEHLIQQLDADSPDERDEAEKELLASGEKIESLLKSAADQGKPEVRARCRDLLKQIALARKRREFWAPSKPLTLALKGAPLKEALDRISAATGYPVRPAQALAEARVTLALEGVSFLQALDAVCLAIGAWYRWDGSALEIAPGDAPRSRSHAGPILVTADLGRPREDGDLGLDLRLEWEPGVRVRWYEIEIESVENDQGGAVSVTPPKSPAGAAHRAVYYRSHSLPAEGERRYSTEDHVDLTGPSRNITSLKSVKGKLTLYMPEELKKIRFENPAQGEKVQVGSITAALSDVTWGRRNSGGWNASIDLDLRCSPASKHCALFAYLLTSKIRFIDADGKEHETENGGASSSGHSADPLESVGTSVWTNRLSEARPPKAVDATIVSDVWEKTFPFELKGVERPKSK